MTRSPSGSDKNLESVVLLRRPRPPRNSFYLSTERNPSTQKGDLISSHLISSHPLEIPSLKPKGKRKDAAAGLNAKASELELRRGDAPFHSSFLGGPEVCLPGNMLHTNFPLSKCELPHEIHLPNRGGEKDQFMLNNFLFPVKLRPTVCLSQGSISRQNYLKLTSWFSFHVPGQEKLNETTMEVDLIAPSRRVPKRQALLGKWYIIAFLCELSLAVLKALEKREEQEDTITYDI